MLATLTFQKVVGHGYLLMFLRFFGIVKKRMHAIESCETVVY